MCGESWHAMKDSLTHCPSSQGWAPGVLPFFLYFFVATSVLFVSCLYPVCTWMEGCGGRRVAIYLLLCIFSILGLVCYKHTIHGM